MANTAEILGDAEVEGDGFGVPDVQEAVGFGREAGGDGAIIDPVCDVSGDDVADEVFLFGHDACDER